MFNKSYFEKEFPNHIEQFKKNAKQSPKIVLVLGGNHHIVLHELQDLKEDWFSFWIEDGDYKAGKKPPAFMISRYDQVRQILFYPTKEAPSAGFRIGK